jgi:hypothetical protein
MTYHQENLIREFANDFGGFGLQVRGRIAKELGRPEIRSKKHSHLAIKWDELGNAFVLTAKGQRLNLLANEI